MATTSRATGSAQAATAQAYQATYLAAAQDALRLASRRDRFRPVAVVSFAQSRTVEREDHLNEVEMLMPVVAEALGAAGITKKELGFVCSGSSDYLVGAPFSFVMALDAVGAWPPMRESHVEMDGAFALYEAWTMLQDEDMDTALVYSFGRSSPGDIRRVLAMQLDPYVEAPMWPDHVAIAALQARALVDSGKLSEKEMAEIALRSWHDAMSSPTAQVAREAGLEELLAEDYLVSPLRPHAVAPVGDGAAAVVLAAGEKALELAEHPAWITGIDHRIEPSSLGARDLTVSGSTRLAGIGAGVVSPGADDLGVTGGAAVEIPEVDLAELHAPFAHQEPLIAEALGLDASVRLNPSGGALSANPLMVAGLARIGEAARRVMDGSARVAVAHATSGPCLQQNLVCLLAAEAEAGGAVSGRGA